MIFDPDGPVATRRAMTGWIGALAAAAAVATGGAAAFSFIEAARIAAAYPPQGAFVPVPGGRLHYTERRPVGPVRGTVVLLHGASGNQADVMLPLGDRLAAAGFRVIAPDRPGHGWSDRPGGEADASPAEQARLIRAGLQALGVEEAIVLGHSWAGALAVTFALEHADLTRGLVLVAPVTHPWTTGVSWYYDWAGSPLTGPLFNALLTMPIGLLSIDAGIRSVFAPQTPPAHYATRTAVYLLLRPGEFTANAQDVGHLSAFVTRQAPRMGAIVAPTAIVTGDHDGIVWTQLHSFGSHRDIRGSTLTVLPGVGHSPHWAEPGRVVEAVETVADRAQAAVTPAGVTGQD